MGAKSGALPHQVESGDHSWHSRSKRTKNNVKAFADGINAMNASISGVKQLRNLLQRAWTLLFILHSQPHSERNGEAVFSTSA